MNAHETLMTRRSVLKLAAAAFAVAAASIAYDANVNGGRPAETPNDGDDDEPSSGAGRNDR